MKTTSRCVGLLLLGLFALAGCHELGHLGDIGDYGSGNNNNVVGEVRRIDTRNREIQLRTDAGRNVDVRYDNRTRVSYRQREYDVTNLEPGDYVAMRAERDRDGRLYTDQVTVRESAQDRGRGRGIGRLDSVEGTIEYVDARRGTFDIRSRQNRLIVVMLPDNAPRDVSERFNRLREGDNVRIEGRFITQERFELENFV